jgi:protein MpaA
MRLALLLVLLLLPLLLLACAAPQRDDEDTDDVAKSSAAATAPPQRLTIGYSVEGRPIECLRLGDGPAVLYIATIHGDEAAGTPLLQRLAEVLNAEPRRRVGHSVYLIPVANPDGFAANERGNVRGIDLNRNFPADNWRASSRNGVAPLGQPEARALHDLIEQIQPVAIISIHQPLRCLDYDGPGRELAQAMAAACDLPVRKLGGRPGSLGSYAGETLGIAIVTVELPRSADNLSTDDLWDRYGDMLLVPLARQP